MPDHLFIYNTTRLVHLHHESARLHHKSAVSHASGAPQQPILLPNPYYVDADQLI